MATNKVSKALFIKNNDGRVYCTQCNSTDVSMERNSKDLIICNICGSIGHSRNCLSLYNKPKGYVKGITHIFTCTNCKSDNLISGHTMDDIELCQCCRQPHGSEHVKAVHIEDQSDICRKCGSKVHATITIYDVDYCMCSMCGTLTNKK